MSDIARMQLDVTLAEFQALREEINSRSRTQQALTALTATVTAALVGFAFSLSSIPRAQVLMLTPVVTSLLAMLWLDHHRAISRLGLFIKVHHRRSIIRAFAAVDYDKPEVDALLRWEWESCRPSAEGERRYAGLWVAPQWLAFFAPGGVAWGSGAAYFQFTWRPQGSDAAATVCGVFGGAMLIGFVLWVVAFREKGLVGEVPTRAAEREPKRKWGRKDPRVAPSFPPQEESAFLRHAWSPPGAVPSPLRPDEAPPRDQ